MIAASFCAWQTLSAQHSKFPKWESYITSLGLLDKPKNEKRDLEREAAEAMEKVNAIFKKAKK